MAAACTRVGGIDETFSALLRYPSGLAASLQCSIRSHRSMGATLVGTEGVLEVSDTFLDPAGALTLVRGDERREIPVAASDRYREEVEDFSAALQEGRPPLLQASPRSPAQPGDHRPAVRRELEGRPRAPAGSAPARADRGRPGPPAAGRPGAPIFPAARPGGHHRGGGRRSLREIATYSVTGAQTGT